MGFERAPRLSLRATLCEVERGLYQITYHAGPGERLVGGLPTYQVARTAAAARRHIERRAGAFGFDTVIWDLGPAASPPPDSTSAQMMSLALTG